MSLDSDKIEDLPWANQKTILREIDLRRFGIGLGKRHLSRLWTTGGPGVTAILHAEQLRECKRGQKLPEENDSP